VFHTLVRAIKENEPPLSSSQSRSINGVEPKGFNTAVLHRLLPLEAVRSGGEAKSVADDDVAHFMDHRFSAINF